jgi:hypothetical protein
MRQLIFDCSICAKIYGDGRSSHLLSKGAELSLHEWFSQCSGCGSFGIKLVDEALVRDE